MDEDRKIRLLQLMLYREAGGVGYDPAINHLSKLFPDFYSKLIDQINGIKDFKHT